MTTALITMVKDEADVIVPFLKHHAWHVDALYVADHGSTDGTRDLLANPPVPVVVSDLKDPGYWQSKYMTALAQQALADGHDWVVAADADEIWYVGADIDRRVADYLCGVARDTLVIDAEMYHHVPTSEDREKEPNVFCRIGWRQRERGALPKVACRLHPQLVIGPGNHSASLPGAGKAGTGLVIRHFPWRSAEQYCNPPEAPIWMGDLSFKELGSVEVGDSVIGWGRTEEHKKVHLLPGIVTAIHHRPSPIVRVDFESGRWLRCSPDHLWHQYHYRFRGQDRSGLGHFKPAKVGRSLTHVIRPSFPATGEDAWLAGWLAGMFDGEGHRNQIAQSQKKNPEIYAAICEALRHFDLPYSRQKDRISLVGGRQTYVDFANIVRPTKRSTWVAWQSAARGIFGKLGTPDRIVSVEPDGFGEVIGLTTTTGCYVAWGYASKNCRKIRNGQAAYKATNLDPSVGAHWRAYEGKPDEAIADWFWQWGFSANPGADRSLIFDPAPVRG